MSKAFSIQLSIYYIQFRYKILTKVIFYAKKLLFHILLVFKFFINKFCSSPMSYILCILEAIFSHPFLPIKLPHIPRTLFPLFLVCVPKSLMRTLCVILSLELTIRAWWAPQWVHNLLPCLLSLRSVDRQCISSVWYGR